MNGGAVSSSNLVIYHWSLQFLAGCQPDAENTKDFQPPTFQPLQVTSTIYILVISTYIFSLG